MYNNYSFSTYLVAIEPIGYLSLVADAVHNFVDGLALGGAWASSAGSGIATAIAVVVHEIPQVIWDIFIHFYC